MRQGTKIFGERGTKDGNDNPGQRWEVPPVGPDMDLSWHEDAACYGDDPRAQAAMEDIQKTGQRPWDEWCVDCPVWGQCLAQGLQEDTLQAPRKYAPFIYGGLAPEERARMNALDRRRHAARLRYEKAKKAASQAA